MKLLFITSSLECGRDGVGDYARSLGRECARLGHPCVWLALNDRHLPGVAERVEEGGDVLRLPAAAPWAGRVERAAAFLAEKSPDWVSLQFVPHGFHPKGIVVRFPGIMHQIIGKRRLHVMMHELWSYGEPQFPLKQRIVGAVQRRCVIRMLRLLRPAVIHTNLPLCVDALAAAAIHAELLPLFGNIAISDMGGSQDLAATIRGEDSSWEGGGMMPVTGGLFGSVYPRWQPEPLLSTLARVGAKQGRMVRLISAGRIGSLGEPLWEDLRRKFAGKIEFVRLGELSARMVSQFLQLVDFGIPTTPWHLLGKSSAAASMLDHGLPVCISPDVVHGFSGNLAVGGRESLVHRCDGEMEGKLLAGLPKITPRSLLCEIASTFLARLERER